MLGMGKLSTFIIFCASVSFVSSQTEDFAFEQDSPVDSTQTLSPLRRLWGVPDTKAQAGKLIKIAVPPDAFEGPVAYFEASGAGGSVLPQWLQLEPSTGTLQGVPGDDDVGETYVTLTAIGQQPHHKAKDIFNIQVVPHSYSHHALMEERCSPGKDVTTLTVVLDKDFATLNTDNKITMLTNLARYLGMSYESFSLIPHTTEDLLTDSALMAGPGNVKKRLWDRSSVVQWQVGCNGNVMSKYSPIIQRVKHDAYDGTLAEVLQLPVIGWHLSLSSTVPPFRRRREIVGSGDSENDTDDVDILDPYVVGSGGEMEESVPDSRVVPVAASPVFAEPSTSAGVTADDNHPHRHHHGESVEGEPQSVLATHTSLLTSPVPYGTIMPTPTMDPERPVFATPLVVTSQLREEDSVAPTPSINQIEPSVTPGMSTPQETEPLVIVSSSGKTSTEALTSTTPPLEVTTKQLPEVVTMENTAPIIKQKLPRQPIKAGKPYRYVIPEGVFWDNEDGDTRKLHLTLTSSDGGPLPQSWIYFNPENQEIIALPLEEHVSRWEFTLTARDREGLSANETLELTVQHHKARRTVTHTFNLDLALQSTPEPVEWQLMVVDKLASLYHDPDSSHITVLSVTPQDDPVSFTWTNDSLPRSHCPREQIDGLLKVLMANEDGKPADNVKYMLAPQITVVRVSWTGKGVCSESSPPEHPPPPNVNYPPSPRNQVDLLNATLGQLLVHVVPEDTFYDPEDGSTRNMKLSLLNIDRTPLSSSYWLQFDTKNQEFYGIPMASSDMGKKEFQLVCQDSGGLDASDGLVVWVQPAAKTRYNVEFSMTLDIDHESFEQNPAMKRHFVERLAELFGDRNTSAIVLSGVSASPTHIVWHNRSLPTDYCPDNQIRHLRQILLTDNDRVSSRVSSVLGPEFPVTQASLTPTASCQGALTPTHPVVPSYPIGDVEHIARPDEYLLTVIVPAIVIAGMLLCAGLVACLLYRRRRTGKMSVGSEDERQSFRSKGIPVIFQDELEERPEPANKSPVIMKEEKPPLPPPEYHQRTALLSDMDHNEDSPYQPPPPFTSSRDSARPRPTPTYRLPPPSRSDVMRE